MFERVTIRTQDHQVFNGIIFWIFVYMMYSKDLFFDIISTGLAFHNEATSIQKFSKLFKIFGNFRFSHDVNTFTLLRAKYFFVGRRSQKILFTLAAFIRNRSLPRHGPIVAFARAIFSLIAAARYMFEFYPAYLTVFAYFFSASKFIFAIPATIFSSRKLVDGNIKFRTTGTIYKFSSTRFHYATP